MFISFEGCEGCGKTTHSRTLAEYLREQGKDVLVTREPGGTRFGEKLREILLDAAEDFSDRAEIFLFAADRIQHVQTVIRPALQQGKVVLCDRYIDSTFAYQVGGRRLPRELVNYLIFVSADGLLPDLTFYLDVPPAVGLARAGQRKETATRFEKEDAAFHQRVRQSFLSLVRENPVRIKAIDTAGTISETQAAIQKVLAEVKFN
jgi:dTMP kinase